MDRDAGGRPSVLPRRAWYPVAPSKRVGRARPLAVLLLDEPLVLFRGRDGEVAALVDRCPHRNVPLSLGRVQADGSLQCAYHGWRFDGSGRCCDVPGLLGGADPQAVSRRVETRSVVERDGFVWIWADPSGEPFRLPEPLGGEVVFAYDLECPLDAALENALDVPHTAFLHRGLFRGGEPREITAVRRRIAGGLEVQYLGEPVGLGRLRGSQDGPLTFDHWDRFFLPSIAQVEYRVEGWLRIVNTILHLPMSPVRTRAWFVVRFWTRLPAPLVRPIVLGRGKQILRQDAKVLARQTESIRRFGGEHFASTELDLMGNGVRRLLRGAVLAEQGGQPGFGSADEALADRTTTLRI
jgi:phenylpropionate dioxygenase-like ring-hydroxylating dioxygenase large terminal subunit